MPFLFSIYNFFMRDPRFIEILYTREQLEARIKELAQWVNETYKGSKDLVLVGLLKGSIPFMAQLIKDVTVDHVLDFMTVSTYEGGTKSTGKIKIIMDLKHNVEGKDVLIVEDIVDSGLTLSSIVKMLKEHEPKSIKVLTLLDKPEGRKTTFVPDASGFVVPNKFLAGFGLDVKEKLRNVPYIGVFDVTKLDEL